ncbi:aKG-HExxH-type peptide beta-hydroxylase [Streptomyces albipurpureus]|uniref:HEXXH motif-containing putative peptide modification protein n=1 Tax=Streptomyces albipurpureus TaxID=2897419 RepID=A0ABT0V1T2_9ACTN|nr:HEXXH motif-containing putative peptide modification protein [Streptomyces sp. CWNU-1]MCM2394310.1 HEXXH motif-containing putative peptide modification protein [Streptomyces sp. CWNU-1]
MQSLGSLDNVAGRFAEWSKARAKRIENSYLAPLPLSTHSGSISVQNSVMLLDHLRGGATYYPLDSPAKWPSLQNEVIGLRQSTLADLTLRSESSCKESSKSAYEMRQIFSTDLATRRRLMTHPAMIIWLQQTVRILQTEGLASKGAVRQFEQFAEVRDRCLSGEDSKHYIVAGSVQVRRYHVDPLITAVAPPTFDFPANPEDIGDEQRATASRVYPLDFFTEVAEIALEQVATTWPELGSMFPRFVHTLIHVPDGTFRSASAARYSGVVFLSSDDATLLDLEESLVHEFGHQVLYWIMELDPLFLNDDNTEFELPWSGAERDFYGFYHAFYIYILLAHYYQRVALLRPPCREKALDRLREITDGLESAILQIQSIGNFTQHGQLFTENICTAARAVMSK